MRCYILSEPQSTYPSVSKFHCKCFRASALLVTSSDYIFKTLGIQRLAMLTNDSTCISTIGYMMFEFIRASKRRPQCLKVWLKVFQGQSTSSDFRRLYLQNAWDSETGDAHKRFSVHFYHRICGATIYQSLRALTPVSQSLTVGDSEPEHF